MAPDMNETLIGCIGLFLLLALFLTGIELAFAMTFIGFVGFALLRSLPRPALFLLMALFLLLGAATHMEGMTFSKFVRFPG